MNNTGNGLVPLIRGSLITNGKWKKKPSWHFIHFSWGFLKGNGNLKMQVENNFIKEKVTRAKRRKYILHLYSCCHLRGTWVFYRLHHWIFSRTFPALSHFYCWKAKALTVTTIQLLWNTNPQSHLYNSSNLYHLDCSVSLKQAVLSSLHALDTFHCRMNWC